jgi:hypothetical protein
VCSFYFIPREDALTEPLLIIGEKVFKALNQPVNDKAHNSTNDGCAYPESRIVRKNEHSGFRLCARLKWPLVLIEPFPRINNFEVFFDDLGVEPAADKSFIL